MTTEIIRVHNMNRSDLVELIRDEVIQTLPKPSDYGNDYLVDRKWLRANFGWRKAKIDRLIENGTLKTKPCLTDGKSDYFSQKRCEEIYKHDIRK